MGHLLNEYTRYTQIKLSHHLLAMKRKAVSRPSPLAASEHTPGGQDPQALFG